MSNYSDGIQRTDFLELKSFASRLSKIERAAPEILESFYERHLRSFSVRPGSVERISITSTCFALQALCSTADTSLYENMADFSMRAPSCDAGDKEKAEVKVPIRAVLEALILTEWSTDDLFQVPLLLYTALVIDSDRRMMSPDLDDRVAYKIKQLVAALLTAQPKNMIGPKYSFSEYITFQCVQAMAELQRTTPMPNSLEIDHTKIGVGRIPLRALPDDAAVTLPYSLARATEVSFNTLCRQLAYRNAGDRGRFDIMRLAYSLLSYVTASNSLAGTAGREEVPGDGPSRGSAISVPNKQVVKAALEAFFEEQNAEGLWDRGQPIYQAFRRTGRNIGNAFVFATDTVGSLLKALPAEYFRPHIASLEKALTWIEANQITEVVPNYCDAISGQCYGKYLQGWSSPHLLSENGVQAWSTAQTLHCVSKMATVVKAIMHDDVLLEFNGVKLEGCPKADAWNRLLDTDLGDPSKEETCRTLKSVIKERVLMPLSGDTVTTIYGTAYSTILFGPPGTAKTTICEAVANYLGWDFLVIDTSAFLADGLTNVSARIRYVFTRLQRLERCVILFDEIEEFCLDREDPKFGMESRMLTTAMLTAINDLRKAKASIFFLATNRLRAFDSAITRPGRFDMRLFVGTPNLEGRLIQFRERLAPLSIPAEKKEKAEEKYRSFLKSVWTEDVMFFNYLEGLKFSTLCASILEAGGELTDETLSSILAAQASVMTVRGSAREEYTSTMELSRF